MTAAAATGSGGSNRIAETAEWDQRTRVHEALARYAEFLKGDHCCGCALDIDVIDRLALAAEKWLTADWE